MTSTKNTKRYWTGAVVGTIFLLVLILLQAFNVVSADQIPLIFAIPMMPANIIVIPFIALLAGLFPGVFDNAAEGSAGFIILTVLIVLANAVFYGLLFMFIGWIADKLRGDTTRNNTERPVNP